MPGWKIRCGAAVLAGVLVEQGCFFRKSPPKATIVIPPAPAPQTPAPLPAPPNLPPGKTEPVRTAGEMPTLPPPEAPKASPPARSTRRTSSTTGTTPVGGETAASPPVEATTTPSLAPTPSLQPILGSQEIQQRNLRIQQYLDKARGAVQRAEQTRPGGQQRQLIEQVKTFVQQAEEARRLDLVRAENLAERAEVLSRGLRQ